jgi:hypothetical protein
MTGEGKRNLQRYISSQAHCIMSHYLGLSADLYDGRHGSKPATEGVQGLGERGRERGREREERKRKK